MSHLYFQKTYEDQMWAAGTFRRVGSFETNEAGIGKRIIWRSCDFEKTLQHSFKEGYGYELLTQKYQLNSD